MKRSNLLLSLTAMAAFLILFPCPAARAHCAYDPENGRHYESVGVPSGITWDDAKNAAGKRLYGGVHGHLVEFPSAAEENFVKAHLWVGNYWIGAFRDKQAADYATSGGWRWVSTEKLEFADWAPGEPVNNPGLLPSKAEAAARFDPDSRQWVGAVAAEKAGGYLVEYDTKPSANAPALSPSQEVRHFLGRVSDKYRGFHTFAETVFATAQVSGSSPYDTANAEFTYSAPNKYRLVGTCQGAKVTAVSDGTNLFMETGDTPPNYELGPMSSARQAFDEALGSLSDIFAAPSTLSFLIDSESDIASQSWVDSAQMGEVVEGAIPIQTIHVPITIQYNKDTDIQADWRLDIGRDDLLIRKSELRFSYNGVKVVLTVAHQDIQVDGTIDDSEFAYVIPTGGQKVDHLANANDTEQKRDFTDLATP